MAKNQIRSRRRLFLLGCAALVLAAAAGAFYGLRRHQVRNRYLRYRDEGLAASQAGNDALVVDDLGLYIQRYPDDVPALAALAKSLPRVASPKNGNLGVAIYVLRHLLSLEPQRTAERRNLMELYLRTGYLTEALDAADALPPDIKNGDPSVLKTRVAALMGMHRNKDALELVERFWVQAAPDELDACMTQLWLQRELRHPAKQILAIAAKATAARPDDPRSRLIQGFADLLVDDRKGCLVALKQAADAPLVETAFCDALVRQLDNCSLFDRSQIVLQRQWDATHQDSVRADLARRYWQSGKPAEVVKLFDGADPADPKLGDDLLAIRASALGQLNRPAEVAPIANALSSRKGDPVAAAWSLILKGLVLKGEVNAQQLFDACQAALQSDPSDAYLRYFLGEAYASLGENELAVEAWQKVTEQNRGWASPWARMATVLADTGRYESGFSAANTAVAVARIDENVPIAEAIVEARVWSICMDNGRYDKPDELLDLVTRIQSKLPGEEESLCIRVALLGRAGKAAEARAALSNALNLKSKYRQEVLLHLAALSRRWKLDMEEPCFARCEHDFGITPDSAYARAVHAFATGKTADGVHRYEADRAAAKGPGGDVSIAWRLNWARLLDVVDDPRARAALIALADQQPNNIGVQRAVLAARSPRDDAPFMDRTINRVHALTGDKALSWKLARARWLLDSPPAASDIDRAVAVHNAESAVSLLNDVVRLSPDLVEGQFLLARALETTRHVGEAIECLNAAESLSPSSASIGLYRARLLQTHGDFELARQQLERIAEQPLPDDKQRRQAAAMLAQQGESQKAIDLLQETSRQSTREGTSDLLLADLYRQRHEPEKAEAICQKLLENPTLPVIAFAADLEASLGRLPEARKLLARLDALQLDPGERELARADFESRHGDPAQAVKLLQDATQAAPDNPAGWRALIVAFLSGGRIAEARAVVDRAVKALPKDPSLSASRQQWDLVNWAAADPVERPLAIAFVRDPWSQTAISDAMRIIKQGRDGQASPEQVASRLRDLSENNPSLVSLQLYAAQAQVQILHWDDAAQAASRAVQASPSSPDPLRMLVQVLSAASRWPEALDAARRLRDRSLTDPVPADLAIAQAQIALNQPTDALRQLEAYTRDAKSPAYAAVAATYSRAKTAAGQGGAAPIMGPLLRQGATGIRTWIVYAMQNVDPAEAPAWLERAHAAIPGSDTDSLILLAEAWGDLGRRSNHPSYSKTGCDLLRPLADRPDASGPVLVGMGICCEDAADVKAAESYYRRALALSSEMAVAQNNLAMLLANTGGDLAAAEKLVNLALKGNPNIAGLYDTLAFVQGKRKNYDDAVRNMGSAVRLQPGNVSYRADLAQLLADAGRPDPAREALTELDSLHLDFASLPPALRGQIATLRAKLSAPATAPAASATGAQ